MRWSGEWKAPIAKAEVQKRLRKALQQLQSAQKAAPQNEDLTLLLGLAAHYAYNVDTDGDRTYVLSLQAFQMARELNPNDTRPDWFAAVDQCQSLETLAGMKAMLRLEDRFGPSMPPDFWVDYAECAEVNRMPQHVLRALAHTDSSALPDGPLRDAMLHGAQNSLTASSATATYKVSQAWQHLATSPDTFTSFLCGMSIDVKKSWDVHLSDTKEGLCTVSISLPPLAGKEGSWSPTLFILSRPAQPGESLGDFRSTVEGKYHVTGPYHPACPVSSCLSDELVQSKAYPSEGGGRFLFTALAAAQPMFPGLKLETPAGPPSPTGSSLVYFTPNEILTRLPGTIYYGVLLDSTANLFPQASIEYENLMQHLRIDQP